MPNVEHSFVLYALLLEPDGCLRAHITLFELVEPEEKKRCPAQAQRTNNSPPPLHRRKAVVDTTQAAELHIGRKLTHRCHDVLLLLDVAMTTWPRHNGDNSKKDVFIK